MQREAHTRFANPILEGDDLPDPPWSSTVLDPANNVADRSRFYRRVDSEVIVESIKNSVTPSGFSKIISNKLPLISFRDPATGVETIDGPCLLHLMYDRIDPSLNVNVEHLRETIEKVKLHNFGNNVDECLQCIEENYEKILQMDKNCESMLRYTFTALLSGPCQDFNAYIKGVKGDVDSGVGLHSDITFPRLVAAAT